MKSLGTRPLKMNAERSLGPHAVPNLKIDVALANRDQGQSLYSARCAACHGDQGQGVDDSPPVWGPRSYNDGAGLTNVSKLAAWLKVAMQLDETDLTDQEALDIAAYINAHERPKFIMRDHLPEKAKLGEYNSRYDQ